MTRRGRTVPDLGVEFLAFMIGVAPAFFLVFAGMFTDAPRGLLHPERLVSFSITCLAYVLLGSIFGIARSDEPHKWGFALALPAALLVAWYTTQEAEAAGLGLIYLGLATIFSFLGAYGGSYLRNRRKRASANEKTAARSAKDK